MERPSPSMSTPMRCQSKDKGQRRHPIHKTAPHLRWATAPGWPYPIRLQYLDRFDHIPALLMMLYRYLDFGLDLFWITPWILRNLHGGFASFLGWIYPDTYQYSCLESTM